jgi:hypothetical protein
MKNIQKINQHIYITSDEEIKEEDWFYLDDAKIIAKYINVKPVKEAKKIILTTDQDLIKDGVQAIDDEFLEWFVKNPSCESVEVSYEVLKPFQSIDKGYILRLPDTDVLEEPKPHSFCETPNEKCTMNYCDENGCQNRKRELVEPEKETNKIMEEALKTINRKFDINWEKVQTLDDIKILLKGLQPQVYLYSETIPEHLKECFEKDLLIKQII